MLLLTAIESEVGCRPCQDGGGAISVPRIGKPAAGEGRGFESHWPNYGLTLKNNIKVLINCQVNKKINSYKFFVTL